MDNPNEPRLRAPKNIEFGIVSGSNDDKKKLIITSSLSESKEMVESHNYQNNYSLKLESYTCTLDQWLDGRSIWCQIHQIPSAVASHIEANRKSNFKVSATKRPGEERRQAIQAILRAVFDLYTIQRYHGYLHHLENYGVQLVTNHQRNEADAHIKIILLYKNMVPHPAFPDRETSDIKTCMENDIFCLQYVIFNSILHEENMEKPLDVQHLEKLFTNASAVIDTPDLQHRIANHPSLWHVDSRFYFFDKLWLKYKHAKPEDQYVIEMAAAKVNCQRKWEVLIPPNTPFHKYYATGYQRKKRNFKYHQMHLSHFIRSCYGHINDVYPHHDTGMKIYIDSTVAEEHKFLDYRYVEHVMTCIFPDFLANLYDELYKSHIFV